MSEHSFILFDGVCNFCNGAVNFLIRQDKKKVFRFVAMQSAKGRELLEQRGIDPDNLQTFVFIENGKAYQKSTAALRLARHLPWYWQWAKLFWAVPPFVRDGVYNVVARNRYRWFGRREQCMLPTSDVASRFIQ